MEQKLVHFIQDHQLLNKNKTVLVGVSGGPDSIALLHFLSRIKQSWNLKVHAISIDHQLRGRESEKDIEYVESFCKQLHIPFFSVSVDVNDYKLKNKVSTQVAARHLRYQVFEKRMNQLQAHYLALGHHGDDQIETILMSLIRTTNLSSLTGIPVKRKFSNGYIIRPLLCVTKSEVNKYCEKHRIQPRIDVTNEDISYTRNYIRKYIVPKLKEKNENLHTTIQLLSESLKEDELFLIHETKKVVSKVVTFDENRKKATIDVNGLKNYTLPLQRRVFRLTLDYLYSKFPDQITYAHERLFLSLLEDEAGNKMFHFPHQLLVERSYDHILLYFQVNELLHNPFSKEINEIPAIISLPDGGMLSITCIDEPTGENDIHTFICSRSQVSFPLKIRTRKQGDRMRYKGLKGSKKVKDIFIDEKIPRHERDRFYIVADNKDEIIWLIGLRKRVFEQEKAKGPYLLFQYKQEELATTQ